MLIHGHEAIRTPLQRLPAGPHDAKRWLKTVPVELAKANP